MRTPRKTTADRKVNVEKGKKGFQPTLKREGITPPTGSKAPLPPKTSITKPDTNVQKTSKTTMVTQVGTKSSKTNNVVEVTVDGKKIDFAEIQKIAPRGEKSPWNKTAELLLTIYDQDSTEDKRSLKDLKSFVTEKCDTMNHTEYAGSPKGAQHVSHQEDLITYTVHSNEQGDAKIDLYVSQDPGFFPKSEETPYLYKEGLTDTQEAVQLSDGLYENHNYNYHRWN